jgi:tRNA (cytidine/uridine-2'-O-)-methyltransferase
LHVILVNPQIPPNTGNIARLCAATGTPLHLVHPLGFSTDAKQLRRAGLDYWKHVSVHHHDSFEAALLSSGDGPLILLSTKAERPYTEAPFAPGARLIFGAETTGLSPEILERYKDSIYRIPMWGHVRSLNLSTSAGIVVYEGYRQLGVWDKSNGSDKSPEESLKSDANIIAHEGEFKPLTTIPGKLFIPQDGGAKKHPCPDCQSCAWCSDARCKMCRGGCGKKAAQIQSGE